MPAIMGGLLNGPLGFTGKMPLKDTQTTTNRYKKNTKTRKKKQKTQNNRKGDAE